MSVEHLLEVKQKMSDAIESSSRPKFSTLVELLSHRAAQQPDRRAFTFLLDGEMEQVHLTYHQLDRQARAIGAWLQTAGASGNRVLLLYPPGLEYIAGVFGCLYGGCIAVPAYPPDPARLTRTLPRLKSMIQNAGASIVFTTAEVVSLAEFLFDEAPELKAMRWVATDEIVDDLARQWQDPHLAADELAFLQFTSGSTMAPRGVMLSHHNVLHNLGLIHQSFSLNSQSRGVIWLPPYHDMGLIGGILTPLYSGILVVLMSPIDYLKKPYRWLKAISRHRASISGGPNFAYDLCVRKTSPEERASLDLSTWRLAFNGAEPVRADTLKRFVETFAPYGFREEAFYPCYGLAEATLIVSGGVAPKSDTMLTINGVSLGQNRAEPISPTHPTATRLVSCGRMLNEQNIVIANPETYQLCAPDQVGEIWISGPSVALGYWHCAKETKEIFQAHLAGGEGPFMRTGDLGFMHQGELFVTGRLKDLIIILGRNHYPQDIERTVEQCHPMLRPGGGAAVSFPIAGEERLVIIQEIDRRFAGTDFDQVFQAIRQAVAQEHELQVHAVVLLEAGTIPKTSSGKIQRYACREGFLANSLESVAKRIWDFTSDDDSAQSQPETGFIRRALLAIQDPAARLSLLSLYLQEQVARLLRLNPTQVALEQPLGTFGLDSLRAIELGNEIENSLGSVLPITDLLQGHSLAQLASQILATCTEAQAVRSVEKTPSLDQQSDHPLSFGQRALWFLHQLAPESPAYNIASAIRILTELDVLALQRSFQKMIEHHAILRTTFAVSEGEPVQRIQQTCEIKVPVENSATWDEPFLSERLVQETQRPFDLEHGPLLRVHLFRRSPQDHILLIVLHHLTADLWSLAELVRELAALYSAEKAGTPLLRPMPVLQYTDFVRWQAEMLTGPRGEELRTYWLEQLDRAQPTLNLLTDRPRPPIQTYRGESHRFRLNRDLTRRLKDLAIANNATLYMTLLASFQTLLYRYTGQEDILVGSPTASRSHAQFADIVGYLANPIVLRGNLSENPTFTTFLACLRKAALEAFAHQDYPFSLLVEQLAPERDASRSPLFQVMFMMQKAPMLANADLTAFALGEPGVQAQIGELLIESVSLPQPIALFDLTLITGEIDGELSVHFQYNTDLFEPQTIARMADHFRTLLGGIVAHPDQRLAELPLFTAAERKQLLGAWNDTQREFAQPACIHHLIEAQAAERPDAIAVVCEGQHLAYAELNRRANQLAHILQHLGVGREVLVGLCAERSLEMLIGMLGILKAGGAYLPLEPAYPQERLTFMLTDAQPPVILTQQHLLSRLPQGPAHLLCLDADWPQVARQPSNNPCSPVDLHNLAYVIYTSGSTGKPKGVEIEHCALFNFESSMRTQPGLVAEDILLSVTTPSFDIAALELFLPLMVGAQVILISGRDAVDGTSLGERLVNQAATIMQATPTTWRLLIQGGWLGSPRMKMLCGGEPLSRELAGQLADRGFSLWNMYGPTETTVWSVICQVQASASSVSIGHPIANTQVYLLDAHLNPVPEAVAGELYIGGMGLSRGYLNRPDLTAEKFIPNPFSDEPGARIYKTGDLARWSSQGDIEFLGRRDHQVKIRGFRIELGEIEAAMEQHPAVQQALAVVQEDSIGDKRLLGYVVPNLQASDKSGADSAAESPSEHVTQWQTIWNDIYDRSTPLSDPAFNIAGWNSSYSGEPIAPEEMHEWVDKTVGRILALKPRRVLEIGCGSGLLLFQIAPHCEAYWATDFSAAALHYLEEQLASRNLSQVKTLQRSADDFEDIEAGKFDIVILNSVVQYFPDIEYLLRVLEGATRVVAPGGVVFAGDVRSLPLLEAFHASVEIYRAPVALSIARFRQLLHNQIRMEEELVIAPSFFTSLPDHFPQISHVQIELKRGWHHNELTRFRYDVILWMGHTLSVGENDEWQDWEQQKLSVADIRRLLIDAKPEFLGIRRVPNARLTVEKRVLSVLHSDDRCKTIGELRKDLSEPGPEPAIDPENIWHLGTELRYSVHITWSYPGNDGSFDVAFVREMNSSPRPLPSFAWGQRGSLSLGSCANTPLKAKFSRRLISTLRGYLKDKLPEYMIPSAFVMLEEFPLTPNGKLDRRMLPAPEIIHAKSDGASILPLTPVQERVAAIWSQALGIEHISVHDDFFELGGHSLMAARIIYELRHEFQVELPLHLLFEQRTVEQLAAEIEKLRSEHQGEGTLTITARPRGNKSSDQLVLSLNEFKNDRITRILQSEKEDPK